MVVCANSRSIYQGKRDFSVSNAWEREAIFINNNNKNIIALCVGIIAGDFQNDSSDSNN